MALVKSKKTATTSNNFDKADAFLNIELVDKNGVRYPLPKGLPLHVTNWISSQMVTAATDKPDMEFSFVGTIRIAVSDEDREAPTF